MKLTTTIDGPHGMETHVNNYLICGVIIVVSIITVLVLVMPVTYLPHDEVQLTRVVCS